MKTLKNHWMFSAKDSLKRLRFRQRNHEDNPGVIEHRPRVVPNWRKILTNVRVFSLSVLVTVASGFATPTFAADIEIYSDTLDTSGTLKPNILFMLDNSGSMAWVPGKDENPKTGEKSRLEYLREAMIATINEVSGIANVGIGRFTRKSGNVDPNAAIIFPIIPEVDSPIPLSVSVPIRQTQDDAMENAKTGEMDLTSPTLLVVSTGTEDDKAIITSEYEITLKNHSANGGKTWQYRVKEPNSSTTDLNGLILGIATHCNVTGTDTPNHAQLQNSRDKGLEWQLNNGFSNGDFYFTLDKNYPETLVDVYVNGNKIAEQIIGPNCLAGNGNGEGKTPIDPNSTIIDGQYKVSFIGKSGNTWTYKAETIADGSAVSEFVLAGYEDEQGRNLGHCRNQVSSSLKTASGSSPVGVVWSNAGTVSVTLPKDYPVGYVEAWVAGVQGSNPIIGPVCVGPTITKELKKCNAVSIDGQCTDNDKGQYEIGLSINQNLWTYSVTHSSGYTLPGDWKLSIPTSCAGKVKNISSSGSLTGNSIQWQLSDSTLTQNFSFEIDGNPILALNNDSVPAGARNIQFPRTADLTAGGSQFTKKQYNSFSFAGPGYCEEEEVASTCPVLADPSIGDEKMTICHVPPGNPENAHTIEISKNAWPAHSRNHGDYVGHCFKDLENDVNGSLWNKYKQEYKKGNKTEHKITICHVPPGNHNNAKIKSVGISSVVKDNGKGNGGHLTHGPEPYSLDTILDNSSGAYKENDSCPAGPTIVDGPCPVVEPEKQLVGLRFEYVDIPQGATITSAKISFRSAGVFEKGIADKFVINAEQTDDASSFDDIPISKKASNSNVSRSYFSEDVIWEVSANKKWWNNTLIETPSVKNLVQSVVNQTGWCGGNSMAFKITDEYGTLRRVWSYDGNSERAPRLEVEYTTTLKNEGCIQESSFTPISSAENDAEEIVDNGDVFVADDTLDLGTGTGGARIVGLRFENVPVLSGTDNIMEAHLILPAKEDSSANDGSVNLTITGEATLDSLAFQADDFSLSSNNNRPRISVSEDWSITEPWQAGQLYRSVNIKSIVQKMVSHTNWDASEKTMNFFLTGESGTGKRKAAALEAGLQVATLHIKVKTRLKAPSVIDGIPQLLKTRMKPTGATPIVDALYESLMYFRGDDVTYGKNRQNQKTHLISVPESYTHQLADPNNPVDPEFDRNAACDMFVNPFDHKCASEKIKEVPNKTPQYDSPIELLGDCKSNNYIVLLTDGAASDNESVAKIRTLFTDESFGDGLNEADCQNTPTNAPERCGIALAKFLHERTDVITHTVAFSLAGNPNTITFLDNMAKAGGSEHGVYQIDTSDPDAVTDELKNTFVKIVLEATKGTSSFAPAGVSVSRFNRMRHDNEVYYALFENAKTRSWQGNVKKFAFKSVDTTDATNPLCANNTPAEDCELLLVGKNDKVATDGPYLTDSAADLWAGQDQNGDEILSGASKITSGGAGDQLMNMNPTNRTVLTYSGSAPTVLEPLSTSNSSLDQTTINWIKGVSSAGRNWLMAESLHSTPTAITYGVNDTKVVVGTNDGLLRMIDAENGTEDWAFLPPALFGIQADLMLNEPDEDPLLRQHIYGIDGTPAVWVKESSNIDTVRLFVGMRRGGTEYYALNISNPANQLPELMWMIDGRDSATDLNYSFGFANLGQTWSTPSPVKVQKGYCEAASAALDNGACIALLMGGGYDPLQDELEDTDGDGELDIKHYQQASNIGNAIYMVHALSGRLLWWASSASGSDLQLANMSYPIPSDLTVLDTDGEGSVDRVYAADLAGQVWRLDLLGQRKDSSSGSYIDYSRGDRLANLASNSNAASQRQFYYPPAWIKTESGQDVLAITSGNRVYPKSIRSVQNRAYVMFDQGKWGPDPNTTGKYVLTSTIAESDLVAIGKPNSTGNKGWYLDLPKDGEKGIARPLIAEKPTTSNLHRKVLFFSTYVPPSLDGNSGTNSEAGCGFDEGTSRLYAVELLTAVAAFDDVDDKDKEFNKDKDKKGTSDEDRSIEVGKGMNSNINSYYTEDKNEIIVGNQAMAGSERKPPQRVFWLEED